jgi:Carboxypeptidase regulatory-like domain/TonB dependent receptor-like, beta-barrel
MIEKRSWKVFFLTLCFLLTLGVVAYSQGTSGTFTGTVTDPSGAIVPGAAITVTNQATGVKYNLTSNAQGVYYLASVPPGHYTFEVRKQGFQTYSSRDVEMTVDYVQRLDIKLTVGSETTTVTVEAAAPLVSTEAGRLSNVVEGSTISNMPLNGRNIYELMQLIPGAVRSSQVDTEAGQGTNINGTRMNFNGFLLDGMTNKGLSGGTYATPPPDFVAEFRIQTNNFDAQYSNSAGSITDVSTKSGTNDWHGDAFEFFRNDKLDARNFFDGATKSELRMNEFGGTIGGPIKKDKLFIFGGVEFERFRNGAAAQYFTETSAFHNAVISAIPTSTASLLYKDFPNPAASQSLQSVAETTCANAQAEYGIWDPNDTNCATPQVDAYATGTTLLNPNMVYTDPCFLSEWNGVGIPAGATGAAAGATWGNAQTFANNMARLLGVTSAENAQITANINAACPGQFTAPGTPGSDVVGTLSGSTPMEGFVNASSLTYTGNSGVFYTGSKWTVKGDYQGDTNRVSARFYFDRSSDPNPTPFTGIRGFTNPFTGVNVSSSLSYVHTFSPTFLNEFQVGHGRNQGAWIPTTSQFGVPYIGFDTGEPSFGSYNGYPQVFIEEQFNFKDMLTWVKDKHSMKFGAELKKNYENSEFNVGRPSFYFFDPLYFAGDLSYLQAAGVNPELTGVGGTGSSHIDTSIRAWRNYELGFFFQDDYKISPKLTFNIGLRWDYFSPHTEKYNHATEFIIPSGGIGAINCQAFSGSSCLAPEGDVNSPNGGFTPTQGIFPARYNNWGPRFGFAYDPFGNGKTSIRGGFAVQYESSFYNALSNSRWNLPFYSFNEACPICGIDGLPTYGPTDANGNYTGGAWVPGGVAPTYAGDPATSGTVGNGPAGLGFAGNLMGWLPSNPNLAVLTGIPSPNYRLPYVMNYFLSIQHQISRSTVFELSGVSTLSRHLFWAEDPNRVVGGTLRTNVISPCDGTDHTGTPTLNPCFGHLRTWDTSVNSSYFALQAHVERRYSHGLAFNSSYTWSHSLDYRSTWHGLTSGGSATDVNGRGEGGYSSDPNRVYLEKGNSLFDVRHRLVASVSWQLPWRGDMAGAAGKVLGGWQVNTLLSLQSGFPFTVAAASDYNLDGLRADRPNTPAFGNTMSLKPSDFKLDSGGALNAVRSQFPAPSCTAVGSITCDGNLGRNTFRGPGIQETDFSLFKKVPLGSNESRYLQIRLETFNIFNHTNLNPPDATLNHSSSFGFSGGALDPRILQVAMKLFF